MKRFIALAAFALLALGSSTSDVHAQATRWEERDIKWRTVNASTTNGLTPRDSVFLHKNSAGTFSGNGEPASGYADTTEWLAPAEWVPALDLNAYRSNISGAGGADTTLFFHLVLAQEPGASVTASIDSVFLAVQGSYNGSTPTTAAPSPAMTLLDASATEMVQRAFFTQLNANNPSTITLSTMGAFPYIRFILSGDYGGKLRLKARYLTRDK